MITAPKDQLQATAKRLQPLVWDSKVQGRFHFDLETDHANWQTPLSLSDHSKSGIYLIHPGTYGLEGKVFTRLKLDAETKTIMKALAEANEAYAKTTEKKVYRDHVAEGRSQGKRVEMTVPFGEDREIDQRRVRPRR